MRLRPDLHDLDWRHDLGAAVTIVALPGLILFGTGGRLFVFAVVAMAIMSFVPGYRFVPRDLWLAFLGAFLLAWASFGVADLMGAMGDGEPMDIPHWFVGVMILVPMIVFALVPLWTGRLLKRDDARIAERRKAAGVAHANDLVPGSPAGEG